jgi:ornithine carbamoyltransferase
MSELNHFVDVADLDDKTLRDILDASSAMKANRPTGGQALPDTGKPLAGKVLAMIFEQPSTRTRISFEVGMKQLGGEALMINGAEMGIGTRESIADVARVVSRYVDGIMVRARSHELVAGLKQFAEVPVINGLTDLSHPCQLMADVMTFEEHKGPIKDRIIAWSGDGNNVAASWIHGAARFGYELRMACPAELQPQPDLIRWAKAEGAKIKLSTDPEAMVDGADCVVTDAWVSMHDDPASDRHNMLAPYQVNQQLMARADKEAVFMHCLPAHRGEEVTDEVMDGPQSVIYDEAENRMHAQKGVLVWALGRL